MKDYLTLTDFVNDILKAAEKKLSDETKMKVNVTENLDKNRIQQPINQPLCGKEDCKCNKKEYTKPIIEVKPYTFNSVNNIGIEVVTDNRYVLHNMVSGYFIPDSQTIVFQNTTKEGYVNPGITEKQLLDVLYLRYKNNPDKQKLLLQLMH